MIELLPSFDTASPASTPQDAAAALIRAYCHWHIWPRMTETVVCDGPGTDLLVLPTLMLTAVSAVTETRRGVGGAPVALNVATDVDWSEAGLVWHVDRRRWTSKPRGVSVTFEHGYQNAPSQIVQLATALAARAASNPTRLKRMQVGQRSEDYETAGLLQDEMAILAPYRRIV